MEGAKKFFSGLLKFILIVLLIVVLFVVGMLIWHFTTIHSSDDYLPKDFLVYLKINSIRDIYDNVIDLRAADVIFSSNDDLKAVYKALMEFKSNELSKSWLFAKLLDVETDLVVTNDFAPILIFDPGLLSLPTRLAPILNSMINIEGVTYQIIRQGKITIYGFELEGGELFFSFSNNLIFVSITSDNILALYDNAAKGQGLNSSDAIKPVKDKIRVGGFADIYLNSNNLINSIAKDNKDLQPIVKEVAFNSLSAITFKISNEDIFLSAYTSMESKNEAINKVLAYKPHSLGILKYLPASTNVYSAVNFNSFKDILDVLLYFKKQDVEKIIKDANNGSILAFDINVDQLLFDWIGSELGIFTISETQEPVLFLKIGNKEKYDFAMQKINESPYLKEQDSLVIDNIRIKRIIFPKFMRFMVDMFVKGLETPYFIEMGDYALFSMNAEILAKTVNDYKEEDLLARTKKYRDTTENAPKDANIFLYYDLSSKLPGFLAGNNLMTDILKLYEKGLMTIRFSESEIKIEVSANGVAGKKTISFPGYPKPLTNGARTDLITRGLEAEKLYKYIYINSEDNLVIQDVFDESFATYAVDENSEVLVSPNSNTGQNEIFVFSRNGTLHKFDAKGKFTNPFPLYTDFKNSFMPVEHSEELIFFNGGEKKLYFVNKNGKITPWDNFDFKSPLLSPPAVTRNQLAFYPKSFSGEIWLCDFNGNILQGWPQKGGGISLSSPVFVNTPKGMMVSFLTQAGILNLWDDKGRQQDGFPIDLEGVFYTSPTVVSANIGGSVVTSRSGNALLTLNAEGTLTLIGLDGSIYKQKTIPEIEGKESKIIAFDFDKDQTEEIFIYGETNFITGLGRNFEPLPGFPVKGSQKPSFVDLNYDGLVEMVSGSFDGYIYAYSLNK